MADSETPLSELLGFVYKAHPWHGLTPGERCPETVTAFVEIVPTDAIKYEIDKVSGYLKVDRPQQFSNVSPSLYGMIPRTFCAEQVAALCEQATGRSGIVGDGDPLDICILTEKHFTHGDFLLHAIPIGGFRMIDGNEADDKIIAVMQQDAVYGGWNDLKSVPVNTIERLRHYFLTYKDAPGVAQRKAEITHIYGRAEAHEVIRRAQDDYLAHFGRLGDTLTSCLQNTLDGLNADTAPTSLLR